MVYDPGPLALLRADRWHGSHCWVCNQRHLPGKHNQKDHGHHHGGPGTGTDLIGADGGAQLAADVERGREGFVGRSRDEAMSVIAERQGFDAHPEVVSREEMDRLVKRGGPVMLRGVHGTEDGAKTAAEIHEDMRSGPAQFGHGVYGNGYYFAPPGGQGFAGAEGFADGTPGSLARATLRPGAKVVKYRELRREHDEYFESQGFEAHVAGGLERLPTGGYGPSAPRNLQDAAFSDLGRFAAAKGYDVVAMDDSKAGGYIPKQWLVLNRSALVVEAGS